VTEQDLSGWVEKRNSMFKMKSQTSEDKILLSPDTQEDQLRSRVQALQIMLAAFHQGKTCFLDDILSNLRSLVFYKDKSQYDPLLLRLAAFKKMPLPVYIVPEQAEIAQHTTGVEPPLIVGSGSASFEPQIPWVKMVDFQEYLESPALYCNGGPLSPLQLIREAANTQSSAHFDQSVPRIVEGLKDTPIIFGRNTLEQHIVELGELVVKLGHFVLEGS
jgi:hypothetical protein